MTLDDVRSLLSPVSDEDAARVLASYESLASAVAAFPLDDLRDMEPALRSKPGPKIEPALQSTPGPAAN